MENWSKKMNIAVLSFALLFQVCMACQRLTITRDDTRSVITSSIVLLDDVSTPFRMTCVYSGSETAYFLPTDNTQYPAIQADSLNIYSYAVRNTNRIISSRIAIQTPGGNKEGFYYCTNVYTYACFVGVFQKSNLAASTLSVNKITHSGLDVYWKEAPYARYAVGYQISVRSVDGGIVYQKLLKSTGGAALNKHVVSCLAPGKNYKVKINTLCNFKPSSQGYYVVDTPEISVTTPSGPGATECIDYLDCPPSVLTVTTSRQGRNAVSLSWTVPRGVTLIRSIMSYRNVLSSAVTTARTIEGNVCLSILSNLTPGATYVFSVVLQSSPVSSRAARAVTESSKPVYITIPKVGC